MIQCFYGFDPREEVGCHTFVSSVLHHTSEPVSFTPIRGLQKDGSNSFTYSRFKVPEMMGHKGWALFVDGADMIVKADIAELWEKRDYRTAVQVAQHDYKTKHDRKYVGTPMETTNEDYPRKNWSSVMLINCAHPNWRRVRDDMSGSQLHRFTFIDPPFLGHLPLTWNWLADEYGENPEAKLLHWTAGIPAWNSYKDSPHAKDWWDARYKVTNA